jgi:hypothetical protein
MGKVILEFDAVEEQEDIQSALNGYKWKLAVWDLDQELRQTTKYDNSVIGDDTPTETEYKIAERYRDMIREILHGYGLVLE